jgi:hypothetical protein
MHINFLVSGSVHYFLQTENSGFGYIVWVCTSCACETTCLNLQPFAQVIGCVARLSSLEPYACTKLQLRDWSCYCPLLLRLLLLRRQIQKAYG